jgi:hypothetical protein
MGLKEIGCEDEDWIYLAQDKVLWWAFFEHGNASSGFIKC